MKIGIIGMGVVGKTLYKAFKKLKHNCLGIDLNYYRDMTMDRDIKESDGYSFTIVLKPFGSTRSYGKSKVFGPQLD